jgi:hypothetical protein
MITPRPRERPRERRARPTISPLDNVPIYRTLPQASSLVVAPNAAPIR